jgi:hypothetical protein
MDETLPNTVAGFSRLSVSPIQENSTTPKGTAMHLEFTTTSNTPCFRDEVEGKDEEQQRVKDLKFSETMTIQQLRDALEEANKKNQRLTTSHKGQARNNQRLQERYEHAKADNAKNLNVIKRLLVGFQSLRDLGDGEGDNRKRKAQDFDEEMELDDSGGPEEKKFKRSG